MNKNLDEQILKARNFAKTLISDDFLASGENALTHADSVVKILQELNSDIETQVASYLIYTCKHLNKPCEILVKNFDKNIVNLAVETNKLVIIQQFSRNSHSNNHNFHKIPQVEIVRKMLLGFSKDLRVILLRLGSRLQTLRWLVASKTLPLEGLAEETLYVFAPLVNRLGIWQLRWELEDLAFKFLEPQTYQEISQNLAEKRFEREDYLNNLCKKLTQDLENQLKIKAEISGRPKHIFSIVKKMRGKNLSFDQVFDIRAIRIIVITVDECYKTLAWINNNFTSIPSEFDDYISKPKPNGYQSLHFVVKDKNNKPIEIQIRTQKMHDHAENGIAAHWAYKEAGTKGYSGVSASGDYDNKISMLRQLLAWRNDISENQSALELFNDKIYVLTPQGSIVELPKDATPIDFAYSVHTSLGHRCKGAIIDGKLVALNTALKNGQTIEIISSKEEKPSQDWLNHELKFLVSSRAKAKIRAWFNSQMSTETKAKGREILENFLRREGKTFLKLENLATQLKFKSVDELFEILGKDEFSLKKIQEFLNNGKSEKNEKNNLEKVEFFEKTLENHLNKPKNNSKNGKNEKIISVLGENDLLTQLAKCCKPVPFDKIGGFITKSKGVSIHRVDCKNYLELKEKCFERIIEVSWNRKIDNQKLLTFPVDINIQALNRTGLLRDISESFIREKINVISSRSIANKGYAHFTFTVEIRDSGTIQKSLNLIKNISGVVFVQRI